MKLSLPKSATYYCICKNVIRHTAYATVSWPNPTSVLQFVLTICDDFHTFDNVLSCKTINGWSLFMCCKLMFTWNNKTSYLQSTHYSTITCNLPLEIGYSTCSKTYLMYRPEAHHLCGLEFKTKNTGTGGTLSSMAFLYNQMGLWFLVNPNRATKQDERVTYVLWMMVVKVENNKTSHRRFRTCMQQTQFISVDVFPLRAPSIKPRLRLQSK